MKGILIALVRDDVTLFLVTSKRDLVVKISRKFKRNIVHIERVCWKFYKMKNRQNDSNNLVLIPTKPRFGVERNFYDIILHKRHVRYVLYSSWIPEKSSPPSLVLMLPEKRDIITHKGYSHLRHVDQVPSIGAPPPPTHLPPPRPRPIPPVGFRYLYWSYFRLASRQRGSPPKAVETKRKCHQVCICARHLSWAKSPSGHVSQRRHDAPGITR